MLDTSALAAQWLKQRVTGTLCTDSRAVQAGDGFIAWPGAAVDGRSFVKAALQSGAAACLVEADGADAFDLPAEKVERMAGLKAATGPLAAEYFAHPSQEVAVLAVTGTNGKTSTAWWLAQALSAVQTDRALPCGMIGTLGVGRPPAPGTAYDERSVVSTGLTTPDPVLLQSALRRFADEGLKACAIEASSIGIEEARLDGTQIRVALFTNFTQDHLDYHAAWTPTGNPSAACLPGPVCVAWCSMWMTCAEWSLPLRCRAVRSMYGPYPPRVRPVCRPAILRTKAVASALMWWKAMPFTR